MMSKYNGTVVAYDQHTRLGEIQLNEQRARVPFHSTSFYAGRVTRQPRTGDHVSIAITGDPASATMIHVCGVWVER